MSASGGRYLVDLVAGGHKVTLKEQAESDEEVTIGLIIDGDHRGDLNLLRAYYPGVAIGPSHVVVWAGTVGFLAPLSGGSLSRLDLGDVVDGAYAFGSLWLFVCELSTIFVDPSTCALLSSAQWNEVLLRTWWSDGQLNLEDLQGRHLRLEITDVQSRFVLVTP